MFQNKIFLVGLCLIYTSVIILVLFFIKISFQSFYFVRDLISVISEPPSLPSLSDIFSFFYNLPNVSNDWIIYLFMYTVLLVLPLSVVALVFTIKRWKEPENKPFSNFSKIFTVLPIPLITFLLFAMLTLVYLEKARSDAYDKNCKGTQYCGVQGQIN